MPWSLTVAAVIEQEGRYLLVEERDGQGPIVLNQPAGHVEEGEAPLEAIVREVREETGLPFAPTGFVGVYALRAANGKDYLRLCFTGSVPPGVAPAPQDPEILRCGWFTKAEIAARPQRSGLVMQCLEDAAAGSHPLSVLKGLRIER
jgi:8-oxo-dGTP pyrophosphatase MutT (NUDIX family)